ncbi:MAG: UvrD-helicase domain-containing protein [Ruminococcus sp.]|nr:UvrD-helicase domain-containing protein [Ruminococcus sp.]
MDEFITLKKAALEKYFSKMNPQQRQAVFKIKGPLLILAGAGSGKTTVLVNRIANMIFFGNAYNSDRSYGDPSQEDIQFLRDYAEGTETDSGKLADIVSYDCVRPWNILAITFTNKAAGELKDRISAMLGESGQGLTAATFHSACVRILRREADRLGYTSSFTIYDSDDSRRTVKRILSEMDIPEKMFPPKSILGEISHSKDSMVSPEDYIADAAGDYRMITIGKVYKRYQQTLFSSNAMDFDDIICNTVRLFEENPDVLDHYQNLYKYIMVDEYQDTNKVQFKLVSMLSKKYGNLCVVGDDDQSIYKFRGATIENILNFENEFSDAGGSVVIKLEQNYRSTQNILTCANELIKNNQGRKGKNLWTSAGDGEKVMIYRADNERDEAKFISDTVLENVEKGAKYSDHAVLYRMNAQSNAIEQALIKAGIPYRIFGGLKFYDRKEIKDILAYLQVIDNHSDLLRLRRIINEPKRGIGEATVNTLEQVSSDLGENPINVMRRSDEYVPLAKRSKALKNFAEMIDELTELSEEVSLPELLDEIMEKTGYANQLKLQGIEGEGRLENIEELKSTMAKYEEEEEEPTLWGFLEEISLYTDIDTMDESGDCVMMMTVHSAKGLEFPCVFAAGMEENIFPSSRSMESEADVEEERRLAYVAITRAKSRLVLTYSGERMLYGQTNRNRVSRFVKELPKENTVIKEALSGNTDALSGQPNNISLKRQMAVFRAMENKNSPAAQSFKAGDRISHKIFGEGTVLKATPMSGDTLLEIAFDKKGTKKVMANYAKITKV